MARTNTGSMVDAFAKVLQVYGSYQENEAQAEERRQRAKLLDMQQQQAGLALEEAKTGAADRKAVRDALATTNPIAGQQLSLAAGGNTFYKDPAAAAMAAEQESAIADMQGAPAAATPTPGFAVGQKIVTDQTAAQQMAAAANVPAARRARAADVLESQGRVDEADKLREQIKRWEAEGVTKAIDHILAGGDEKGAEAIFNANGSVKIDRAAGDKVEIVRRYEQQHPVLGRYQTAEVRVTKGGKTELVPDALAFRANLHEKQAEMLTKGEELRRGDERNKVTDIQNDRRTRVQEEQVVVEKLKAAETARSNVAKESETARHNKELERAVRARSAWLAEDWGDKFKREAKAIEEFLGRSLTPAERENMAGVKTGKASPPEFGKLADDITKKQAEIAANNGKPMGPADIAAFRTATVARLDASADAYRQLPKIYEQVKEAMMQGEGPLRAKVAELRKQGLSDEALSTVGVPSAYITEKAGPAGPDKRSALPSRAPAAPAPAGQRLSGAAAPSASPGGAMLAEKVRAGVPLTASEAAQARAQGLLR